LKYLKEIIKDAFAFICDKEARIPSNIKFPNGRPMSIREAKIKGLFKSFNL
jgi:hypothetical protein